MIYNKPQSTSKDTATFTFCQKAPVDVRTASQGSVTHYTKEQLVPYASIRTKKRKVNKTARAAKVFSKHRHSPIDTALSLCFCIAVCAVLCYLAASGIYAPREICAAVSKLCSVVYQEEKAADIAPAEKSHTIYTSEKPEYLSASQESFTAATLGEVIEQEVFIPSTAVVPVSSAQGGTTGADGQIRYTLVTRDLSAKDPTQLINQTKLSPNTAELLNKTPAAFTDLTLTSEPLVLILHTHATECYSQSGDFDKDYLSTEPTRSDNTEENVVRVGKELADTLGAFGINTLHCTTLHDKASFINAYTRSKNSAEQYLKEHPSIRFVIDLHRDAITEGNQKTKTAVQIGGQSFAQLMFVVGTDQSYNNHPKWQENLSLALDLCSAADETYPELFRKTNLRGASFNQQLSSGYMLLEVGTCGNNLDEALRSARAFGTVFAGQIMSNAV